MRVKKLPIRRVMKNKHKAPVAVTPPTQVEAPAHQVRRRVPRRVIKHKIGVLAAGIYSADAVALELGEGGMLILTKLKLDKLQKVVISVRIRGVLQGVMLASVMYGIAGQPGEVGMRYGLQFDSVDFDVKRKIRNFVASGAGETANSA